MNTRQHRAAALGTTKPKSRNAKQFAQLHLPIRGGYISDPEYRAILADNFGVTSSKDLTAAERDQLIAVFRNLGWLNGKGAGGSSGPNAPTPKQWAMLARLCLKRGWGDRFEARGLQTFVRNVAKVDAARFLDHDTINDVIVGLERWLDHDEAKAKAAGAATAGGDHHQNPSD